MLCKLLTLLPVVAMALLPVQERYPQVISHRGASGYAPEHSLASYQLAMDLMTDYIEPDLVVTKDGQFIAMHDLLLDDTTDVASHEEFSDRYTTKRVDGMEKTGYFVNDFTVEELKTLRLIQRVSSRSTQFNGFLQIPTFTEIMNLAQSAFEKTGRTTGIYLELKSPSYHATLGYQVGDMLVKALTAGGYAVTGEDTGGSNLTNVVPIVVQCFEPETLRYLNNVTDLPMILLTAVYNQALLEQASEYAVGVGPEKSLLLPEPEEGESQVNASLALVQQAHDLGLALHPWTFKADSGIDAPFNGDFDAEQDFFYCCLGIDGLFTEHTDRSAAAVRSYLSRGGSSASCAVDCSAY